MYVLKRRTQTDMRWTALMYLSAILLGFGLSALLIWSGGADVEKAFRALYKGAFGSEKAWIGTLAKATPLILTGLATVIAFRAQIWSIGQEGQVYAGAMAAYWAAISFTGLPVWVYLPLIILAAMVGGAVLGGIAAWLREQYEVNEIISTVMLNYLIVFLLSYLIGGGPWTDTSNTVVFQQTASVPAASELPILWDTRKLHIGFLIALGAAAICQIIMSNTPLGFEIRALGANPIALRFKGTKIGRTMFFVMLLSGALAGLAGMSEIFGTSHRLRADTLFNLGYTGIIVGMIGGLTPWGAVIAGIAFGGLANGAVYMKLLAKVPDAMIPAMEGIMMITFLCAGVAARYRIEKVKSNVSSA